MGDEHEQQGRERKRKEVRGLDRLAELERKTHRIFHYKMDSEILSGVAGKNPIGSRGRYRKRRGR